MMRRSARAAQQPLSAHASDVQARADAPSRAPPSYSSRTLWPDGVSSTSTTPYKQFPRTTGPAPAPLHSSCGTRPPAQSTLTFTACRFSCQGLDTDVPQPSQPAPDGWSCKGRGDDVRHPLTTDAPALPKLCSRALAGGNRLGPQISGHPAQMRPHCAPGLHCSTDCSVRLTTGAPWGTQARCRWADLPVPAGLQALIGLQVLSEEFCLRQKTGDTHHQAADGRR